MTQVEIGKKVEKLRNQKGLTQEELSAKTNISVRTIQRIEKGEVKARAYTLKILSEALGYNLLSIRSKNGISGWLIALHLSNFVPVVVIPLVIWLVKREESEKIDRQGATVINYQIIVLLINIAFYISSLAIVTMGNIDYVMQFMKISVFYAISYWGLNTLFTIANLIWSSTDKDIIYPHLKIVR